MTGARARAAVPLLITYWLVLLLGLVLYTAARTDAPGMIGILWGGAIFGTLVGHTMGLADIRLWFTAVIVGGLALLGFLGPSSFDTKLFWMTFAPATISAALSVADRWSLAAFWFPAMIWMLTILDGTHGKSRPDGIAGVLLGALAIAFVIFLRVRESRRVALWRAVSIAPLATAAPTTVFKERPGKELGRAGWMLATSAITFTFTAWLAPQLWEVETFGGDPLVVASQNAAGNGPPCCEDLLEAERSRVKEYFDFGRGRDELSGGSEEFCRQCGGGDEGGGDRFAASGMLICTDAEIDMGYCVPCTEDEVTAGLCEFGMWHFRGGGYGGGGGGGGGGAGGAGGGVGGSGGVGGTGGTGGDSTGNGNGNGYTGDSWANTPPMPTPVIPSPNPEPIQPDIYEPPIPQTPPIVPEQPPEPVAEIKDQIVPTPPEPVAMPNVLPEPSVAPPQQPEPPPAPTAGTAPTKSNAPSPSANRAQRPAPSSSGSELMRWLSAFIAAIVALQLFRFLFRPLRRAIALRHLRKPFWEETIDQRVSNWWQLVLVGLRDAGWRTTADEAPREFAKRVGIDGVDKCAAILDRTRHGIRVDNDDLTEMSTSAEVAYRSARSNASTAARAAAQIRWPLA